MQQEYGKLVSEYQKNNININKTEFSHMLKWVRDKVLQPSTIVQAFAACGMQPFDFAASYAYKQVPPPEGAVQVDQEDEWTDIKLGDDNREGSSLEAENKVLLDTVTTSATESGLRHSSCSSSRLNSQNNSHSSTPDSQSSHTHAECLRDLAGLAHS